MIDNWWRQGMTGGAKAHYDCIKAFSKTDFIEDLQHLKVPVLIMHGDDDQIVPIADSAVISVARTRYAVDAAALRDRFGTPDHAARRAAFGTPARREKIDVPAGD